jgi:predicted nucleotidyltransferase
MGPKRELLDEMTRRVVDCVQPLRIIVFGSAARGEMGRDSDLDILVVMPDGTHRLHTEQKLHRALRGLPCAKDIVVVVQSDVDQHADNPYLIIHTALTEGREVYRAA